MQPAEIAGPILNAHDLINKLDPHFRYDFSVDSAMPDLASSKGAIFVESRGKGEHYFTLYIYEKYDGALQGSSDHHKWHAPYARGCGA